MKLYQRAGHDRKELERMLQMAHGEYEFDPVVTEEQRQWWFGVSMRYLVGLCRFYDDVWILEQ